MAPKLAVPAGLLLLAAGVCFAGVVEVQVKLPAPQKVDTTSMRRLLVASFRANDHPELDLPREVNRSLRDLFRKKTGFEVVDAEPLPLPEQPIEDVIRNTDYWKRLGARFNADLLVGGTLEFATRDQSGFQQEDIVSELTGQRLRRSRWVDRESFKLDLGVYFFRGSSGELLYEDHFIEEMVFDGKANDDLTVLHQVVDRVSEGILGIVTPRPRVEVRHLFTE
ncbi:MAG TPA: hypothetical protein VJV23_01360 [Candidatus Polarisedimenticolia bacterium]|nr:hypothetical protein [Candidatus Polarisedimenticolia bacterium]